MTINKKLFGGMLVVLLAGLVFWFSVTKAVRQPMCDGVYTGRMYCKYNKNIALTLAINGERYKLKIFYLDNDDVDSISDEGRVVYRGDVIEIGRGSNVYYHIAEDGRLLPIDWQAREKIISESGALKKV
ncbi:MAG: hypothetical protein LBJ25_03020 [Candidatus Margulisbacteria bacterium]|nr:hypothetical protein [Candidatus Margulisiibacteriota bacterium]